MTKRKRAEQKLLERKEKQMSKKPREETSELLSKSQQWYWKNPEKARALQRAKYKRYPEKVKAWARAWQERNPEKFKLLARFNSRIWYWKNAKGDMAKVRLLEQAKKKAVAEFEEAWSADRLCCIYGD